MPVDVSQFSGKTYMISLLQSQDYLTLQDVYGDGAPVFLLPSGLEQGQRWQLVDAGGGQCSIRSPLSRKVLTVEDARTENNALVIVREISRGAKHQLWTLENTDPDVYQILSVNNGKALGISPLKVYPPRVAQRDADSKDRSQLWALRAV